MPLIKILFMFIRPDIAETIVQNIANISENHPVYLIWVPAHIGVTGNEIADYLAKRGAKGVSSSTRPSRNFLNSV